MQSHKRNPSKLSYFHNPGKEPLLTLTVGDVIDRAADIFGDITAIVTTHQNISKTYTEYKKDVNQLAASLVSLKLPVGSRVAILAPRLYEVAQLLYSSSKAGLVLVGIHADCLPSQLEFCLNKAECAALILADTCTDKNYYEMLLQIAPELEKSAPGELKSQRLPFLKHVIIIGDTRKPGTITFDDLMTLATAEDHATMNSVSAQTQFDQDAFIQFSSGTTGQPKPARLSHFNVVNNANIVGRFVGFHKQHEIFCLNAQLIFGFGRTLGVLTATMFGSTVVLPGPFFEPKSTMGAITKYRCTVAFSTPTVVVDMVNELQHGDYDVSSLRKAIVSSSVCDPDVVEKARTKLNTQGFYIMYGATETSPIFSSTNPDEPTDRWIRTIGTPLDHVEVKVVDTEGRIVPVNTRGELCTRGPHVFKGYLNDDAMTKEALRENWYHTGDEGTMCEDGRITFLGRIKEMINTQGYKVPPLEVESVLNTHPNVEEAQGCILKNTLTGAANFIKQIRSRNVICGDEVEKKKIDKVFGVPDKRVGHKVCAWIKLQPDKTLSHEDVKTFCKGKINDYKIPEYVLFVDSFPRTLTGKVQKHKMREESVQLLNL